MTSQINRRNWPVTTRKIAEATGRNPVVVRRDIVSGKLVPWDLLELAWYVIAHAYQKHHEETEVTEPSPEPKPQPKPKPKPKPQPQKTLPKQDSNAKPKKVGGVWV